MSKPPPLRRRVALLAVAVLVTPLLFVLGQPAPARADVGVRPTENVYTAPEATPVCRDGICVHYAQDGTNDVPTEDDGGGGTWPGVADNGVPDLVDLISTSLLPQAATTFADAGYRAPVGDGALGGGTDQVDFYVAELAEVDGGASCVRETPDSTTTTAGYCLIDNDYSAAEYGTRLSPVQNLELDVLHQYFYLVQWAYTAANDLFGDAAASWVEDEIYTSYNRNRAYLPYGPLGQPQGSLYEPTTPYDGDGRWIFFRYLSERFPARTGALPTIVREYWEARTAYPDRYWALLALEKVLTSHGTALDAEVTEFTRWNLDPARSYREGAAYKPVPVAQVLTPTKASPRRTAAWGSLRDFVSRTVRIKPGKGLTGGGWRIRLASDIDTWFTGLDGGVVLGIKRVGQPLKTRVIVDPSPATLELPFGTGVEWVSYTWVSARVWEADEPDPNFLDRTLTVKALRR